MTKNEEHDLRYLHVGTHDVVDVQFVDSTFVARDPADIDRLWQAAIARHGRDLFDGPMCRLEMFHVEHPPNTRLVLEVSRIGYKAFLGTNLHGPRDLPVRHRANPIGVSPALVTADDKLLLGRRNNRVAYHPHRLHPFSGSLEPNRLAAGATVFDEVRRELAEELHLTAAEVTDIVCTGIVEDLDIKHPELIFRAKTPLAAAAVMARLDPAEHAAAEAIAATPAGIAAALERPDLTPVARAALTLYGQPST
jgi:hypothetical protein